MHAKRHFSSYTTIGDEEEIVYMRDSRRVQVFGNGKILLELTSSKTLALNDVVF